MGNKTFDFSSRKKDCLPKNDPIWPEISIFVHFGPGLAGSFGWWLWRAGCISQDFTLSLLFVVLDMAELRAYMLCQFCITPLLLQMSLTFSPFIIRGLEEGRGEKLENNFTLFFNLKSDWKRNLLFRSSSCASTLSQVKKKPFSSLLRNWIEDMRTLSKSLSQQFLIIITTVPNFFFPKEA